MPHITLQASSANIARLLDVHFAQIEAALREASSKVLGFGVDQFVVLLPAPLLKASDNAEALVIYPFASDREKIHGLEVQWRDAIAVAWHNLILYEPTGELKTWLPDNKVAVWTQIAPGARWGSVSQIIEEMTDYRMLE